MNSENVSASDTKFIKMTTEPVEKLICRLAIPTIISMLITTFYNLADTFFVRQLESDSMVAAVGVVLPLMNIIQAIGFFFGHGSGNYISRALGRQNPDDAKVMATTGFFYAIFMGFILLIFGIVFRNPFASLLGAKTEATLNATVDYMIYILIGAPFMLGAIVLNNQLRMQGNAFFAMVGLTVGGILNLILDPLLIFGKGDTVFGISVVFGAKMGIAGAAIATSISQFISFILLFIGITKSDNIKINPKFFSAKFYYLKGIFQGGLPSLARQGLGSIAAACLNHSVGIYLSSDEIIDATQAAMTGVSKIMMFLSSALIGFGQGFQPVCGFNYGAKKYTRVRKAYFFCLKVALGALVLLSVLGFIFSSEIVFLVAGSSETAFEIASFTLRAQLVTFPLMSWVILCNMMLQNIGLTTRATIVAMARQGITFIPCVLILPLIFSPSIRGIEFAQPIADILALIISLPIGIKVLNKMKSYNTFPSCQ